MCCPDPTGGAVYQDELTPLNLRSFCLTRGIVNEIYYPHDTTASATGLGLYIAQLDTAALQPGQWTESDYTVKVTDSR